MAWSGTLRSVSRLEIKIEDISPLDPELKVAVFDGVVPKDCIPPDLVRRSAI
jgi:hypothetical protein